MNIRTQPFTSTEPLLGNFSSFFSAPKNWQFMLFFASLAVANNPTSTKNIVSLLNNTTLPPDALIHCDKTNSSNCIAVVSYVFGYHNEEMRGYFSDDAGQSWTQGTNAFTWDYRSNDVKALECSEGNSICVSIGYRQESGHGDGTGMLFYTRNGGLNWAKTGSPSCTDGVFTSYDGCLDKFNFFSRDGKIWNMTGICQSDAGGYTQTGVTYDAGNTINWTLTRLWKSTLSDKAQTDKNNIEHNEKENPIAKLSSTKTSLAESRHSHFQRRLKHVKGDLLPANNTAAHHLVPKLH